MELLHEAVCNVVDAHFDVCILHIVEHDYQHLSLGLSSSKGI